MQNDHLSDTALISAKKEGDFMVGRWPKITLFPFTHPKTDIETQFNRMLSRSITTAGPLVCDTIVEIYDELEDHPNLPIRRLTCIIKNYDLDKEFFQHVEFWERFHHEGAFWITGDSANIFMIRNRFMLYEYDESCKILCSNCVYKLFRHHAQPQYYFLDVQGIELDINIKDYITTKRGLRAHV